ncbi:MAG: chemotaxis protein, partial [Luteimonas sp.]|nr:chemotaxis protein [Luteimonas sp.]
DASLLAGTDFAGGDFEDEHVDGGESGITADAVPATRGTTLELVDVDALLASVESLESGGSGDAPAPAVGATPAIDLEALEQRVSGLSLADVDSYGHGPPRGAVLVEGGLGGPDAVRQLLAAIPEGFPRAVLVRLHLDGGRYDRLVKQMARAAQLPVALAEAGQPADAGTVYFVPPELSLERAGARLVFVADEAGALPLLGVLPAGDSALLLLSGSSLESVDAAMTHVPAGLMVAGQALDGCYDATASNALIARGATVATPAGLAEQLAGRWPS